MKQHGKTHGNTAEFCRKFSKKIHPWRLTWNIIMEVWKIIFLSKWVIGRFHVNLPGCTEKTFILHWIHKNAVKRRRGENRRKVACRQLIPSSRKWQAGAKLKAVAHHGPEGSNSGGLFELLRTPPFSVHFLVVEVQISNQVTNIWYWCSMLTPTKAAKKLHRKRRRLDQRPDCCSSQSD